MTNQVTAPEKARKAKGVRLAERPPKAKKFPVLKVVLIAAAVLVLAVVGALTYGLAVYDRIYPNVTVGGIDVSGLSAESAARLLEEQVWAQSEDQTIPLLIAGEATQLTLEKAGIRYQTGSSAEQAWNYGREGGFFQRAGDVISSLFSARDFELTPELYIDNSAIEAFAAETAQRLDIPVVAPVTDPDASGAEIRVTVGKPGQKADAGALSAMLLDYIRDGDYSQALVYVPQATKPQPVNLGELYEKFCYPAENAKLDISDKNSVNVIPEKEGRTFDQATAQALLNNAAPGETVTIPLVAVPAEISASSLQTKLFTDELSTFTTYLDAGNSNRVNNIRLAANFINGTILLPGDEFSFNRVVGERTAARGFREAGAYINGKLVEDTGGGICQMSTTLYNAAIRANLKITERRNHSMTVGYVPLGTDATVNWGSTDMKFVNDTDYPVKILSEQSGSAVKVTIIGTKVNNYTVTLEASQTSSNPCTTVTKENPALAPGERRVTAGHNGATAVSYRVIKDGSGKVVSRNLEAKSTYNRVDTLIEVGPGGGGGGTETPSTPKPETPNTPAPGTTPPSSPPETTPPETTPPETTPPETTPDNTPTQQPAGPDDSGNDAGE